MLRPSRRRNLKAGDGFEAELVATADGSADGSVLRQRFYWCGNSFDSGYFPENLPSAVRLDLGAVLVSAGVAEPDKPDDDFSRKLKLAVPGGYGD